MRTGELSRAAGVHVETIRFYERQGLLPCPKRLANGYRSYGARHVERLTLIRQCRALDMSLADVRLILRCMAEPAESCRDVTFLIDSHLETLRARLEGLHLLERRLSQLRAECGDFRMHGDCGILRGLSDLKLDAAISSAAREQRKP